MIHPTRRAVVALGVAAPLAVAAAFLASASWLFGVAWLVVVAVGFGIDALALLGRRPLDVQLGRPEALYVGEQETVTLTLRGRRWTATEVLLDVEGPAPALAPATVAASDQRTVELGFSLLPRRRGAIRLPRAWLRADGPLGVACQIRLHRLDVEVAVLPNIVAAKRQALAFSAADAPLGSKPQHQKGSGTEFEALRDYTAGLDRRAIDWKHSARHRKLLCKEYQTERNHHVVLALDTGRLMAEPVEGIAKIDRVCTALLLLCYASLKAGDRVGLCAFDARTRLYLAPRGGMSAMAQMQRAFAELDYSLEETNFTLALTELGGQLNRRSLIVVATDFVDTVTAELMLRNVGHLARRHLVVFVTPANRALSRQFNADPDSPADLARAVVAHDILRERQAVFARLRRLGILCVEAPAEGLGVALVNRYLGIKKRDLI